MQTETGSQGALRGSGGRRHEVHSLGRLFLAQTRDGYLERLFQAIAPAWSTSRVTNRCSAPAR